MNYLNFAPPVKLLTMYFLLYQPMFNKVTIDSQTVGFIPLEAGKSDPATKNRRRKVQLI